MTDLKVVSNEPPRPSPDNAEVIRRLEEALAFARNGDPVSVAIAILNEDGTAVDCYYSGRAPYTMVGILESLKSEFIFNNIEMR